MFEDPSQQASTERICVSVCLSVLKAVTKL
jgi:hypothetical protein